MATQITPTGYREPHSPRRLTQARTEVNATTTMVAGMPEFNFAHPKSYLREFKRALLATAIFRSWHFILLFTIEATVITWLYQVKHYKILGIQSTLMNVLGTVLGFVISYRSSASFDRYNEGRRYWSQVVHNVRMFSRVVWFNVPDVPAGAQGQPARVIQEHKARSLVEKKTVLNLLEAYAVSLKHYLRGEEGILYEDLYPLIKFLPAYAPRPGVNVEWSSARHKKTNQTSPKHRKKTTLVTSEELTASAESLPANFRGRSRSPAIRFSPGDDEKTAGSSSNSAAHLGQKDLEAQTIYLDPPSNPPAWHIFDMWPFYLCIRNLQKSGTRKLAGKMALRDRAKNGDGADNVPLEITLYLSGYVAALSQRGVEGLATGTMMGAIAQLVEALTGLERILSTPVPWAYQVHLWTVTLVWLLVLPFQILTSLGWLTIPGTALAAFVYCGLMKCAEELEDPFGYDYNDLNLDHFTHNIVRQELKALTDVTMPDPATWAFVPENDAVYDNDGKTIYLHEDHLAPPAGWTKRDGDNIHTVLSPPPVNTSKSSGNAAIGAGVMQASGNHSFGGPGGAGLIAGSAVAAAGMNTMPDMSNNMVNSQSPPTSN